MVTLREAAARTGRSSLGQEHPELVETRDGREMFALDALVGEGESASFELVVLERGQL